MTSPRAAMLPTIRRDPAAKAIILAWRRLTSPQAEANGGRVRAGPGAPTLVACSGGADSSALLLALAAAAKPGQITVAHVVHDMRDPALAHADRDAVRDLATSLGLPFTEAAICVHKLRGNKESNARRLRYAALARIAAERGIPYIATAHHAGDQTETLLMALLRGAGPRGLGGIDACRRLAPGSELRLIRPMLHASRADAERICALASWAWREDHTNADTSRLRSALRHGPARDLVALRPGALERIARSADLLRDAAALVRDHARDLLAHADTSEPGVYEWPRRTLRSQRTIVVAETLRLAACKLLADRRTDKLTGRLLDPAAAAVRDRNPAPRAFDWPGLELRITSKTVRLRRLADHG